MIGIRGGGRRGRGEVPPCGGPPSSLQRDQNRNYPGSLAVPVVCASAEQLSSTVVRERAICCQCRV
jgi:hypothetical protein